MVDDRRHEVADAVGAVAGDKLGELALGDVAGGELSAQIAEQLDRQADVLLDQREQGLVAHTLGIELERRDAQAFLVDLGRVRGVGPCDPAADVGVVADRGGEREPPAVVVERLEQEDVGQVHAALEGVVHDEDVARPDVLPELRDHRSERGRDRAEMARQRQALRHELAVRVAERRRVVHVVLEHARVGRAEHGERHLVGDREDRVAEQLEGDRVVARGHGAPPLRPAEATPGGARRQLPAADRLCALAFRPRPMYRRVGAQRATRQPMRTTDAAR